ncbi:MAG: hypothetical protein M1820_004825 [Bogoriella megaspora]|nr:MAG: hypothetical protein M1820_004825 [Bogoriella megaspora]
MSLFNTLDRNTTCSNAFKIAHSTFLPFLYPAASPRTTARANRAFQSNTHNRRAHSERSLKAFENIFVSALVKAGTCPRHARYNSSWTKKSSREGGNIELSHRRTSVRHEQSRGIKSGAPKQGIAATAPIEISREEFKDIVDVYQSFSSATSLVEPDPFQSEVATVKDMGLTVVEDNVPEVFVSDKSGIPADSHEQWVTDDIESCLGISRLADMVNNPRSSHSELYELYRSLPPPRAPYLPIATLRRLLHRLSVVPRKTEVRMLRYLSILDDLKASNIPLSRSEYTSAITFAGRAFHSITTESVASALRIYRAMEAETRGEEGVTNGDLRGRETRGKRQSLASIVTFTALFDIATKALKFPLADLVAQEMKSRGIEPSRHYRVSRIYYEGIKADGEAVRNAYVQLVDSGEIVDTVVLNCVIGSLIRAGEVQAAEMVFEKMKRLDQEKRDAAKLATGNPRRVMPPTGWRRRRELGKLLARASNQLRHDAETRIKIQDATPVAPDCTSYATLIRYYAEVAGNIDRVLELLDEMEFYDIPLNSAIYICLFKGFEAHGGVRYTSWTKMRLEQIWTGFCAAVERDRKEVSEEPGDLNDDIICFERHAVWKILKAFAKCATQQRTLEVWQQIRDRWKPSAEDVERIYRGLAWRFPKPIT